MAYPATFRYSKEHQWIDVQGDIATIGITDYAQSQLNEIVSVDLPKPGATLEAGQPLGSVESVKTVNEIDAPVSGEVVEVNAALKDAPEKINSDPHGQGMAHQGAAEESRGNKRADGCRRVRSFRRSSR